MGTASAYRSSRKKERLGEDVVEDQVRDHEETKA